MLVYVITLSADECSIIITHVHLAIHGLWFNHDVTLKTRLGDSIVVKPLDTVSLIYSFCMKSCSKSLDKNDLNLHKKITEKKSICCYKTYVALTNNACRLQKHFYINAVVKYFL